MANLPAIGPNRPSAIDWLQKNLFSNWFSSLLTLLIGWLLGSFLWHIGTWIFTQAKWNVISANLPLFMVGRFPVSEYWRVWLISGILASLGGITWSLLSNHNHQIGLSRSTLIGLGVLAASSVFLPNSPPAKVSVLLLIALATVGCVGGRSLARRFPRMGLWMLGVWLGAFFLCLWLLMGGMGLARIGPELWNGLLLTVFMAAISITLSFPLGVMFALGRQSGLPVVKFLSIAYIEFFRGLPLVGILFAAQVMLPLILPGDWRIDRLVRAIAGLTIFTSAYLAEAIRGGLQSIPRGQVEAAKALGLNTLLITGLIVLPQALRAVIPAIVNLFLSLFKDTSLLAIVGLVELTGISKSILANPEFLGRFAEVYLFVALVYWLCCYLMAQTSRQLEKNLGVGSR